MYKMEIAKYERELLKIYILCCRHWVSADPPMYSLRRSLAKCTNNARFLAKYSIKKKDRVKPTRDDVNEITKKILKLNPPDELDYVYLYNLTLRKLESVIIT